jgi:hypothetical protein
MRVFTAILFVSILLSCKKTGMNYVKGTVYEYGTGEPVKGATVYLNRDPENHHKAESVIDSAVTDEKGEYLINFSKNLRNDYFVSCKCVGYLEIPQTPNTELEHGRNALTLVMTPISYVQLRFIKTANSGNSLFGYFFPPGSNGQPAQFASYYLSGMDSTALSQPFDWVDPRIYAVYANQNNSIYWEVRNMWSHQVYGDFSATFFAKKGDTLKYTITFN